jgi:TolB-like protein/class 3 adenylate cyclase/Tfp pilus assembly protein PilF
LNDVISPRRAKGPTMKPARPAAAPREGQRLAVLPLANISSSPGDDYFADGLTEELISTLSRIPGLSVIARTSAMAYKGTQKSIAQVGQELKVRTVLEGSVRKSGPKLRIAVRLIDAATEADIWSENYDRELREVFEIQREIAQRIGRALKIRLRRPERNGRPRSSTADLDAYNLYLQGRFHWNLRTEVSLRQAIVLFERAIEKDRNFALAFSGIADAYAQIGWLEFSSPTETFPQARAAAERALAIDDKLAEAHASLGFVHFLYEREWTSAETEFQRAISLNPGYPTAHQFYADFLKAMGRMDEAQDQMKQALEQDPVSMAINTGLGHVLYLSRDYDAAIERYRTALRIDPTFAPAHLWFGRPYLQKGLFAEAIAEVEQAVKLSGGSTISLAVLAHVYASAGMRPEAVKILEELLARGTHRYIPSYWIALVYTGLGDVEQALTWLEKAGDERSSWIVWIAVEPRFDGLRSQPRFVSLLRRMGLPTGSRGETAPVSEARRLVAIMFTDVVGFTRLTQADEAGALRLLEEHRSLLRPLFAARGGREVKTLGDGFMVEFGSAVESVRCALELQEAMARRNSLHTPQERIQLRVGIHVGDVVREGNDLMGDGVNVASRVEPLARPGGICITGPVWDQVRNKVPVKVVKIRAVHLKNVSAPVEVYRVV